MVILARCVLVARFVHGRAGTVRANGMELATRGRRHGCRHIVCMVTARAVTYAAKRHSCKPCARMRAQRFISTTARETGAYGPQCPRMGYHTAHRRCAAPRPDLPHFRSFFARPRTPPRARAYAPPHAPRPSTWHDPCMGLGAAIPPRNGANDGTQTYRRVLHGI